MVMTRIFSGILIVSAVVLFGACAAPTRTIRIGSTPTGADVRSTPERQGPRDFLLGQTPLVHTFVFGGDGDGPATYNLEFKKPGFEPKTVVVKRDETAAAIDVTLDREMVRDVEKLVVVVSDERGYTLERRTVRAWVEDIEREGLAASNLVRIGDNQSVLGMTVAPDGNVLYFALGEQVKDERGRERMVANLRAITATGGGLTQVTSGQWLDASPTVSSDGQFLVFNSNRIQLDRPDIFRISTAKTGGIAVLRQTSDGANYQPSTAAGGVIAFTYKPRYQGRSSGEAQIWTLGGEAGYPTQLRGGSMPAVSPSGREIAFVGDDKQLWVMPVGGQNPVQLTSDAIGKDGKRNPAWSPDGRYIVFASDVGRDGRNVANYDIWLIPARGGVPQQLTTNGSDDDFPVVSPDRKHIYFVSNRGFREGIWRIPFPKAD
jgi:Tol biopolymer transport system component